MHCMYFVRLAIAAAAAVAVALPHSSGAREKLNEKGDAFPCNDSMFRKPWPFPSSPNAPVHSTQNHTFISMTGVIWPAILKCSCVNVFIANAYDVCG